MDPSDSNATVTNDDTSRNRGNIRDRTLNVIILKTCDKAAFCERYLQPGIPCVIEDLVTEWPAFHKWDRDYLKQACSGTRVFSIMRPRAGPSLRGRRRRPHCPTSWRESKTENRSDFSALRTPCMTSSPAIRSLPTMCDSRSLQTSSPAAALSVWTDWILGFGRGYRLSRHSCMLTMPILCRRDTMTKI